MADLYDVNWKAVARTLAEWLVQEDDRSGLTADELLARATEKTEAEKPSEEKDDEAA